MDHCDPTLSAALAFGEATEQETLAAERHLEHCAACREELAALRELADTARRAAPTDGVSVRPSPRVWEAVAAEIAAEAADRAAGGTADGTGRVAGRGDAGRPAGISVRWAGPSTPR
ncbi:hypothetical protein IQ279_04915 [Streptomyces verrucosisporus]|uniref:hypothetical protein n=1 Tax=Streptomyces verrucosisporus TaxID=1695161 RepID=UPI0019D2D40E|nr:hypothetical protein [Streptomyces verrucosisporus]MBN3928986.1 hypothetical protein [Streptomyces verrucosisporus]